MSSSRGENMVGNAVQPRDEDEENLENGAEVEDDINEVEVNEEEFKAINDQLDQLNVVLDTLETKNDSIHAGLIELLQSNREARKQFKESQGSVQKKPEEAQS